MVKKVIIGALIAVLSVGVLFAIYGFRSYAHHHTPEMMLNWKAEVLTKELGLNNDQKVSLDKVKKVILTKLNEMKENRDRDSLTTEVVGLIEGEKLDQVAFKDALINIIAEHRANMDEMIPEVVASFATFHSTLNAEQKAKLAELIENHRSCGYNSSKS